MFAHVGNLFGSINTPIIVHNFMCRVLANWIEIASKQSIARATHVLGLLSQHMRTLKHPMIFDDCCLATGMKSRSEVRLQ